MAVARWFIGEVAKLLNERGADAELADTPLTPAHIAELVGLVEDGTITVTSGRAVLEESFASGRAPAAIVRERDLGQVRDEDAIEAAARAAIAANARAVEDYRRGKDSAIQFLVGQVMRETRGRADANQAATLLRRLLDA